MTSKIKTSISRLERLYQKFNSRFNYRHWYSIKISYRSGSGGHEVFNFNANIGVISKKEILRRRNVTKMYPLHTMETIPKNLLTNGKLQFDIIAYIGYIHDGSNT